jgi:hypothetical protein
VAESPPRICGKTTLARVMVMPNSKLDSCTDKRIIHCRALILLSPGDRAIMPICQAECVLACRVFNRRTATRVDAPPWPAMSKVGSTFAHSCRRSCRSLPLHPAVRLDGELPSRERRAHFSHPSGPAGLNAGTGHEGRFPPHGLNGRYRFRKRSVAVSDCRPALLRQMG